MSRTVDFAPHVLREYALLADGERGALIGPRGDISWMCAPRWDDDAVFASLIGGRSMFAITPTRRHVWGGYYEEGALIWRSRWTTSDGIIECRDALAFPGDSHRAVILRRLLAVRGDADTRMVLAPGAGFGEHGLADLHRDDHGRWHGRAGKLWLRLSGAGTASADEHAGPLPALGGALHVAEGGHLDIVLELSDTPIQARAPDPVELWRHTEQHWRTAVPDFTTATAQGDIRHSYAVLRGLTSSGGGMVAAATMSLPERAEEGRNYDYRYVWIRDQCYAGQAASIEEAHPLLDSAVNFVGQRLLDDGAALKPAYTVTGDPVPGEHSLHLPGYPGGTDIVGNHANTQFQLDAFGEALLLFAAAARHDRLDSRAYRAATVAADSITTRWREPDAGIWELDDRRWTHSRLTCVAGLRRMADHAPSQSAGSWRSLADTIAASTADCVHPSGRWQRAPDDPDVDASLLLPAIRGAVPVADPRSVATIRAVERDLGRDGYVYRFRHGERPLGEAEGAFTLCGFLLALSHHQGGDAVAAGRYFERNRAATGPPGLYCEEYDVVQRQLRGNIPQAFVHALLIETAQRLSRPPGAGQTPQHR
ncbi:glycoside hydrolase family 15 protein [Mycobacterium sp. Y57]|uniref:glycoside hydrolase family 15 protein n=1 Tax=Mycolicibacterium xanthum TaxID=2796469 RepID=UPI001C855A00|nr:glycoside hydrolase family 15 protein [Mycolicibacterium xanthum]MBX7434342.1 glycoside hydrolase family 15 protein [Mycolicibacterium xanthum]